MELSRLGIMMRFHLGRGMGRIRVSKSRRIGGGSLGDCLISDLCAIVAASLIFSLLIVYNSSSHPCINIGLLH